jgi:uncharacterized membrane protein
MYPLGSLARLHSQQLKGGGIHVRFRISSRVLLVVVPTCHDHLVLSNASSAVEILDKRYALGEVDKKEYEEKKSALSRVPQD